MACRKLDSACRHWPSRACIIPTASYVSASPESSCMALWAAAERAMQLDSGLADTYDAVGMMQARLGQWRQAESSFRHAIELSPRDPLWRDHFTIFLLL